MSEILTFKDNNSGLRHSGSGGFTLVELLVAVSIVSIGLLGFASLQGQALRATGMGGATTTANKIVRNAGDRILKNAVNVRAYDGMNTSTGESPNCPVLIPPLVCSQDFADWQNTITSLPQGVLQIATAAGANFDTVTVSVSWQDNMGSHAAVLPVQVAP